MTRSVAAVMVSTLFLLVGCQSETEGIKLACDSPNQVDNELPPEERGRALAAYIEKNVKNDEVLRILTSAEPVFEKSKKLEVSAKKAGIEECALAKLWSKKPLPAMPPRLPVSAFPLPPPSGSAPAHPGRVEVLGALPLETVKGVVEKGAARFRLCYERGLLRDKDLKGIVRVRFVIGEDGKVRKVTDIGSVMPDANVTQCIVKAFESLTFPKPDKGTVTVVYPIILKQGK